MNELKNFKEKKLKEWNDLCWDPEIGQKFWKTGNQFISDLIDEIEKAIPEEITTIMIGKDGKEFDAKGFLAVGSIDKGRNQYREEFLTNLNS